jgi:hypothetical protein
MPKLDLKKSEKSFYAPSKKDFEIVDVPSMNFLMIDGKGDPNTSQEYIDAIEALYAVSYTLKFKSKLELGKDYVVLPLEGLWWAADMDAFVSGEKGKWLWTAMVRQPDHLSESLVAAAVEETRQKKDPASLSKIRFETFHEGLSAQILYIGPYADEGPTIARMHDFIEERGFERSGKHHEIYLSDVRRTAPEKLKTVIRQPMKEA